VDVGSTAFILAATMAVGAIRQLWKRDNWLKLSAE
jgi:hypothetical protein